MGAFSDVESGEEEEVVADPKELASREYHRVELMVSNRELDTFAVEHNRKESYIKNMAKEIENFIPKDDKSRFPKEMDGVHRLAGRTLHYPTIRVGLSSLCDLLILIVNCAGCLEVELFGKKCMGLTNMLQRCFGYFVLGGFERHQEGVNSDVDIEFAELLFHNLDGSFFFHDVFPDVIGKIVSREGKNPFPRDPEVGSRAVILMAMLCGMNIADWFGWEADELRPFLNRAKKKSDWTCGFHGLGALLFAIQDNEAVRVFDEVGKLCSNKNHFVDVYLGKGGILRPEVPRFLQAMSIVVFASVAIERFLWKLDEIKEAQCKSSRVQKHDIELIEKEIKFIFGSRESQSERQGYFFDGMRLDILSKGLISSAIMSEWTFREVEKESSKF